MLHTVTVFKIMSGNSVVDSTSTDQWLTEEVALQQARKKRDAYNASEFVVSGKGEPARIVRAQRSRIIKHL